MCSSAQTHQEINLLGTVTEAHRRVRSRLRSPAACLFVHVAAADQLGQDVSHVVERGGRIPGVSVATTLSTIGPETVVPYAATST